MRKKLQVRFVSGCMAMKGVATTLDLERPSIFEFFPLPTLYKQFDTSTAMVVQKSNGLNSNRRSQNINKICFSHQVLVPALGWGTCRLPPHFHTRHVPRVRLADAARAASFTIFFEFGFLFFLRSTLDRIRLPQCGASVTTCFVAHAEAFPISARFIRTHRPRPA